jgi:hypothetical protein
MRMEDVLILTMISRVVIAVHQYLETIRLLLDKESQKMETVLAIFLTMICLRCLTKQTRKHVELLYQLGAVMNSHGSNKNDQRLLLPQYLEMTCICPVKAERQL